MKRKNKYYVFLLILFISVGFAYLSTNLYTNGTSIIKGTRWSIYFDNIDNENSTYQINNNATISEDKKSVDFEVTFEKPGDEYYFYVDVVNAGNLDAMLDSYEVTGLTTDQKKYLEWNVTYADGIELKKYDLLSKESTDTLRVDITFIEDVNYDDLPQESDISVSMKFKAIYVQADRKLQVERNRTQYKITYNLDGGTITNNPTKYYQGESVIIPNPTKEGYTFAGWTVGKNQLNLDVWGMNIVLNSENQILSFTGETNDWWQVHELYLPNLTLDETYIASVKFVFNNTNYDKYINLWFDTKTQQLANSVGLGPGNKYSKEFIFVANDLTALRIAFNPTYKYVDFAIKIQIEQGNKVTDWEPYISTPTKDIVIPKGSSGNRTYVANWISN